MDAAVGPALNDSREGTTDARCAVGATELQVPLLSCRVCPCIMSGYAGLIVVWDCVSC